MIDVTTTMETFIAGKAGWRPRGAELARSAAGQLGGELDWDEDAGEDWARVLVGGAIAVLVNLAGPLVVVTGDGAGWGGPQTGDAAESGRVAVIAVPGLDAAVLRCDAGVLREAFGARVVDHPALDPDAFSAGDLWFCTV